MNENENLKEENEEMSGLIEELENYFRSTIIPQLFFDRNLILRKYSPAAMKQFNLKTGDIGKHLNDLSNNLNYDTLDDDVKLTIRTGQIVEKEIQTTDRKWYRMNVIPYIERKDKNVNGIIMTFMDINNYVLAMRDLHRINDEHELFIYSVSHDLKAPLNNIESLIEMLTEYIADVNERTRIMTMLRAAAAKMKEMIDDLAQLSHVPGGKLESKMPIRFEEVFDEVLMTLKDKIDESHAHIKTNFNVSEIKFSRKDLRSIIYNLTGNALKYRSNDREPNILLTTYEEDDFTVITMHDNGIGIDETKKGEIFEKFARISTEIEGTGIGLYLVSKIVDTQGGRIEVDSKLGEGSIFKIYLKNI